MLGLAVGAGIQLASSIAGRDASNTAAKKAFEAKNSYLENAQGIISQGYGEARDTTKTYSEKAQTYQDPYVKTGENANAYFGNLSTDVLNDKLNRYLSNADPLMKYADKLTSKSLNAKLAALGRTDSGNAIDEDLNRSTKIAYDFSNLANTRLQQEITMQQGLLNVGQTAANTSTQLQYNTGNQLSNLFTNEAQLNAAYESQKGDAASNMEAIIGNSNANFWGNVGGMAGTFGALASNLFTPKTTTPGTNTPGTTTTPETVVDNTVKPTTPVIPNVVPITNPTVLSKLPTNNAATTNNVMGNISSAYFMPDSYPTKATQNYFSYNPNQPTYGGY